jgi:hypothetical protein
MNALADVDDLVRRFSYLPEALIRSTPRFAQGEALVGGPIAHGPGRIRFGGRYTQEGGQDLATSWADVELPEIR